MIYSSSVKPVLIWGRHSVHAVIQQKKRRIHTLMVTHPSLVGQQENWKLVSHEKLSSLLPGGAIHQGIAAWVDPSPPLPLKDLDPNKGLVLALDGITDPHNVGALWRSAAAFKSQAVLVTKHYSPPLEGIVAKTASGALEWVPPVEITNLVTSLSILQKKGFFCVGLSEEGETLLHETTLWPVVLVIGAEGKGLRHLTRQQCDLLVRIDTFPGFPTLNASVAGAIALSHFYRP